MTNLLNTTIPLLVLAENWQKIDQMPLQIILSITLVGVFILLTFLNPVGFCCSFFLFVMGKDMFIIIAVYVITLLLTNQKI